MYTSTLIKKLARMLEKKANQVLSPYDITHGYTYFLMALFKRDGQTQTELQKFIGIEQPTVVRTLDRMERDGLVERRQSPTDRRVFLIYLTEKGKNTETDMVTAADALNNQLLRGLSKADYAKINEYLETMLLNLDEEK